MPGFDSTNPIGAASGLAASGLAADSRSLEQLKRSAHDDPRQTAKKAATQFEALFLQMVLKSMREATPHSGLLDSQEQDMYRGMLDEQVAQSIAGRGTGLSELIAKQLTRNLPAAAQVAQTSASAAAPVAGTVSMNAVAARQPAATLAPSAAYDAATSPGDVTPTAAMRRDFLRQHWNDAVRAQQATGVPASFILGQAALESGWGQREIRGADGSPSYNLFGIKAASGWRGRTVQVATTEYDRTGPQKTVQSFRAYDSYAAAFQDWALAIGRNPRYADAIASSGNAGAFAFGMQQAGYSTDPAYGQKLVQTIRTATSMGGTG